jgi:hypothetical protein
MPEFTQNEPPPESTRPAPGARLLPWPDPEGRPAGGALPKREVSEHPRVADIEQLQSAYLMHRAECPTCTPDQSCAIARRLEEARRRMAGVS